LHFFYVSYEIRNYTTYLYRILFVNLIILINCGHFLIQSVAPYFKLASLLNNLIFKVKFLIFFHRIFSTLSFFFHFILICFITFFDGILSDKVLRELLAADSFSFSHLICKTLLLSFVLKWPFWRCRWWGLFLCQKLTVYDVFNFLNENLWGSFCPHNLFNLEKGGNQPQILLLHVFYFFFFILICVKIVFSFFLFSKLLPC